MKSNDLSGVRVLFLLILMMKVFLIFLFSSQLSSEFFTPFVLSSISHETNPWQYYFENNLNIDAFPYHSLMLYILYPFACIINLTGIESFLKIPSLLADVGILLFLFKSFPHKEKSILLYYFLNPIIIYAIYVHSQLDLIPTALFIWSIYFLMSKRYTFSSILLSFSLATKFHIIVVLPLILFYLYKTTSLKNIYKYLFVVIIIFFILDLPFLFSDGFINMVLFNHRQSLIFDSFYSIGEIKLLLPVAAILSVYMHFF
ncbi:hypothetical protein [Sulfurospirillum diekertiae]|uniref:Glycosyltransferase RgtA/B/C/D-like domain-containing protein n=1 Tax=Sulfurospirillum diekertiae TaxID=1854492 RepID=A0A1Y0HNI7_9BACT|nr:hypothetical protein [Sulfurospirillum diekertiae]ARU49520.1 hypothetical protein Sdiek1_2370 [Sulfurospirillum diekertiae]ASC94324.1 hypothetical protein Sdiek2_2318 [Sulfurospirillum diekertiae]